MQSQLPACLHVCALEAGNLQGVTSAVMMDRSQQLLLILSLVSQVVTREEANMWQVKLGSDPIAALPWVHSASDDFQKQRQ